MKNLVILGAGTGGTMMLNKLSRELDHDEWKITIVDDSETHYYQPGFLFIPFGIYRPEDVVKPKSDFFPHGIISVESEIEKVDPSAKKVYLKNGSVVDYDYLIIATGSRLAPEETEGMLGELWRKDVFDFYSIEGASALYDKLKDWQGGRLVVNITEMPIKCPVAPLEFAFLADYYFTRKRMREKVEIIYVTPLPEAFTKHACSEVLGHYFEEKNIGLVTEFNTGRIDNENKKLVSWDEREVPFDLLVTVPTNKGADYIERSSLGDELNFVPTHKHTLRSKDYENIFVIGDATNLPSSKAGSVAHFQSEVLFENFMHAVQGEELTASFDGHANCFIESGYGKAIMIDFNYDVEPLPGSYPLPVLGPFSLLHESRMNHFGKLMFRWTYWNMLVKGHDIPVSAKLSMSGKHSLKPAEKLLNQN